MQRFGSRPSRRDDLILAQLFIGFGRLMPTLLPPSNRFQNFENFGAILFRRGKGAIAMFATLPVNGAKPPTIGTRLSSRPLPHCEESKQSGESSEQMKQRPANLR